MLGAKGWIIAALVSGGVFWFVDLPATVRLKAAIVRSLPLSPQTTISTIKSLCTAANPEARASSNCYSSLRSEKAEKEIECQNFTRQIARSSNWTPLGGDSFIYQGADPEMREFSPLTYHPDLCLILGIHEGQSGSFPISERFLK